MSNEMFFVMMTILATAITAPFVRSMVQKHAKPRSPGKKGKGKISMSFYYPVLFLAVPVYVLIYGVLMAWLLTLVSGIGFDVALALFTPVILTWSSIGFALFAPFALIMFSVIAAQRGVIKAPWLVRIASSF